ncbi:MAG TPA: branched-chain amino acid ABC transporter permease, partial [Alphaproteobacteria bacterium]|nr:branched-chain amino acid ABC transporter permease [Alphaproteobacteria bacterium]
PILLNMPAGLSGPVDFGGFTYPAYRLVVIAAGLAIAALLYLLVARTKIGMWVRAGAADREMANVMGVNTTWLFTFVFAAGAALCAVAGALLGPLLAVQVGMGENILILAFVVIVIGGIGSIRGALIGALLVGFVDTAGRAFLPQLFRSLFPEAIAAETGPAVAAVLIYVVMAAVLYWRPSGLFPTRA